MSDYFKMPQLFCDRHQRFEDVSVPNFLEWQNDDASVKKYGYRATFDCEDVSEWEGVQ